MSKLDKSIPGKNKQVRRLLLAALLIMAVPLFLEFCILGPLFLTHSIDRDGYWLLSRAIGLTGIIAIVVGICTAIFIAVKGKRYITDARTKTLSRWVIGILLVYLLIVIVIFGMFGSLVNSHSR